MLKQIYGDHCLSRARGYEWFKRFKDGQESTDDDFYSRLPSTSTNEYMWLKIMKSYVQVVSWLYEKTLTIATFRFDHVITF